MLDADERLSNEDYRKLGMLVNDCHTNWGLGLIDIYPDGKVANFFTHNPRIFDVTFWTKYIGDVDEYLTGYNKKTAMDISSVKIKHFRPAADALQLKADEYYGTIHEKLEENSGLLSIFRRKPVLISPRQCYSATEFKQYNPMVARLDAI